MKSLLGKIKGTKEGESHDIQDQSVPIHDIEEEPANNGSAKIAEEPTIAPATIETNLNDEKLPSNLDQIAMEEEPGDEIPTSPEYDDLWANPQSFRPETYSAHYNARRKWNDLVWTILFWINFLISVALFLASQPWSDNAWSGTGERKTNLKLKDVAIIGAISIAIAFVFSLLTWIFVYYSPRHFIKCAMFVVFFMLLATVIPLAILVSPFILIFSGVIILIVVIFVLKVWYKLNFTAAVLRCAAAVIRKYPSVLFFSLIMFVIDAGLSYLFTSGAVLVWANGISYWLYVYVVFSYFWITSTLSYVLYATCAGVAANWYFLNETGYEIQHPLLSALGHSLTTNFGAIALAGIMEAIVKTFEWIKDKGEQVTGGVMKCCFCCVQCCCKCCLTVCKLVVGVVNQYALIYCVMFGVPAKEGARRWRATKRKKIVKKVVNSAIIQTVFDFYAFAATALGGSVGGLIGQALYGKKSAGFVFLFTMAGVAAESGLQLIAKPLTVMADTIFVGFSEFPTRLRDGASEIYDIFEGKFKKLMEAEICKAEGKREKKICCCIGTGVYE